VRQMTIPQTPVPNGFARLGVSAKILQILEHKKFRVPTPIQLQSIPVGIEGKDIIGLAQTGTGKTLAFGIPLIQRLECLPGRALILLPTRELAQQVEEVIAQLGRAYGIGSVVLIGGDSMMRQRQALQRRPRVIIATPGRLLDHLERRSVKLDEISILVLDEADRMLDMGFAPQINQILHKVPKPRQTMLFSATMPQAIVQIATAHMALPVRIEVAPQGTAAENVAQEIIIVPKENKIAALEHLLHESKGTVLVFSRTKHGARKICRTLQTMGHRSAEIHADRSQPQRREALAGFKSGKYRVLIATDIAARGIDVESIELVVNFDLPSNPGDYVHRIGRTGRAGKSGKAITLVTPDERSQLIQIERLIRKQLPIVQRPGLPAARFATGAPQKVSQGPRGSFFRGGPSRSGPGGGGGGGRSRFSGRPRRRD